MPTEQRQSNLTAAQYRRLLGILLERGDLPRLQRKAPRPVEWRMRELRWQLARYAELLDWSPVIADAVHVGRIAIGDAVILMRLSRRQYDGIEGPLESVIDQWYRDPTAELRDLSRDGRPVPTLYPPDARAAQQQCGAPV